MTLDALTGRIDSGEIDTVIVAFPDVFGRLMGKRFTGRTFVDTVAHHGTHGCNYLLTVDIEMEPQTGFRLANWESGFGDFEFRPDLSTLRILPWQPEVIRCAWSLRTIRAIFRPRRRWWWSIPPRTRRRPFLIPVP